MATVVKKDGTIINITNIKYDENLKQFISKIHHELPRDILTNTDFHILQDEQEEIRQKMIKYQNMLIFNSENIRLTESNKSHPDFFALMISLISDLSKCTSWEQLMDQNRNNSEVSLASFNANFGGEVGDLNGHKCACNHNCYPQNQYLIQNKYFSKYLLIGCDCIEKNTILNSQQLKELKEKRNYNKNYKKLLELNEQKNLTKSEYKKFLKMLVINKLNEIIQNRNKKIKRVLNFIKNIIKDKIDFPKYKYLNISWYKFTKLSKKRKEYSSFINFVLNGEKTSENRKKKLQYYLQF